MTKTFIIAEAGVNHNGHFELARELVDAAKRSGADAIKFQTFRASDLVTQSAALAPYQVKKESLSTQYEMLKKLELRSADFVKLKNYAATKRIEFLSTAFDSKSLAFIKKNIRPRIYKISSADVTNGPLLLEYGKTGGQIFLSTGMANISEIREALFVLAFGLIKKRGIPNIKESAKYLEQPDVKTILKEHITILHCVSEYPAPFHDLNLNAIAFLRETFGLNTGYSDHSSGIIAPVAAVALGATVIEKHLTLDNEMEGPDHKASLNPEDFQAMVKAIRDTGVALGKREKLIRKSEQKNSESVRRSIVALTDIDKGEYFTESNIGIKRPGTGVSPMRYWEYLGRVSKKKYSKDGII